MLVMVLGPMGRQHFMSWPRIDGGGGGVLVNHAVPLNKIPPTPFLFNCIFMKCAIFKFSRAQPCVATENSRAQAYTHGCNHRSGLDPTHIVHSKDIF